MIFTSINTAEGSDYSEMADLMVQLAQKQDGFLGIESARNELGITVSYWSDLEAIKNWRENAAHSIAREKGRQDWYQSFKTRIALVERDYGFEKDETL